MTKENRKLFAEYLEYERLRGHTEQGFIDLRVRVPRFIEYLEEEELADRKHRRKRSVRVPGALIEKGIQNTTVASYVIVASSVLRVPDGRKDSSHANPFSMIKARTDGKAIPRNIPKEPQMEKLLDLSHGSTGNTT